MHIETAKKEEAASKQAGVRQERVGRVRVVDGTGREARLSRRDARALLSSCRQTAASEDRDFASLIFVQTIMILVSRVPERQEPHVAIGCPAMHAS